MSRANIESQRSILLDFEAWHFALLAPGSLGILLGPEGGLEASDEIDAARNRWDLRGSLWPRVLRTGNGSYHGPGHNTVQLGWLVRSPATTGGALSGFCGDNSSTDE